MNKKEYFIGSIINQQRKKVYDKNSPFHGQTYYKLTAANYSQTQVFFAYLNLLNQALWSMIEKKDYQNQYLFTLQRTKKRSILLDFREK